MKAFQYSARFIELAADINTNMPRYVVSRVSDAFNDREMTLKGSKCLVLGAAYKPDIDDIRESPALDVIGLLQKKGAQVEYHDPHISHLKTHDNVEMQSVPDVMQAVRNSDCVIIITNHSSYDYEAILKEAKFIFDSRNALGKLGKKNPKVVRL
jgi:UDP-N-acetyl-D-glucosamine dehydrogenase